MEDAENGVARKCDVGLAKAFESAGFVLQRTYGELVISERKLKQADAIQIVRVNRDAGTQNLGFGARPFVLCGLPVRRPAAGELLFKHRKRSVRAQRHGTPAVRSSVGTGPTRPDLSGDARR